MEALSTENTVNNRVYEHIVRRGLRLPLTGESEQRITRGGAVAEVGLLGDDYPGMRPKLTVREGERIKRGSLLFEDRKTQGVRYTSVGAGTIKMICRGERRAFRSFVISLDEAEQTGRGSPEEVSYTAFTGDPVGTLSSDQVRDLLIETGLWTAFRQRPFEKVPPVDGAPRAIFVTCIDTQPLGPGADAVLVGNEPLLETGLRALVRLAAGRPVYLCRARGSAVGTVPIQGVQIHEFSGPHPAGTAGLHMHMIDPVDLTRRSWHLDCQDAVAIGHLFRTGKLLVDRVVALGGPGFGEPRLVRTRIGASVPQLIANEQLGPEQRVISGSALHGRETTRDELAYLGRYQHQISALPEADGDTLLGWLSPGSDRYSTYRLFLSKLLPTSFLRFSADLHGSERVLMPLRAYERVFPFDMLATPLARALLTGDDETAQALGCLELAEEDVAMFSFVCPSKIDYGKILRRTLDRIADEL